MKIVDSSHAGGRKMYLEYIKAVDCAAVAIENVAKAFIFSCQTFCAVKIVEFRPCLATPRAICVVDESTVLTLLDNGHVSIIALAAPDSEQHCILRVRIRYGRLSLSLFSYVFMYVYIYVNTQIRGHAEAPLACDWTAIRAVDSGRLLVLGSSTGTLTLAELTPPTPPPPPCSNASKSVVSGLHHSCHFRTMQKTLAHCSGPVTHIFAEPARDGKGPDALQQLYSVGGAGLMSWTLGCPESS